MTPWILVAAAYLVGGIPFGLLLPLWLKGVDVREHGSGNIGATNVVRVAGKPAGVVVFLLDVLKGLWPPLTARALGLGSAWQVGAGMAAILGHTFSPYLGFRGGKGIATGLGVFLGLSWQVALSSFALWGLIFAASRIVSLASIAAALSLAPFMWLSYPGDRVRLAFAVACGLFAVYKHRDNIRRLLKGTESRFGRKADAATDAAEKSS